MAAQLSADDLLILREVARKGHYLRAAQSLGLSHTTVSRRIAAIERALSGKVVTRTSTGWELTPLGSHAVDTAERIAQAISNLNLATEHPADAASVEDTVRISTPDAFAVHIAAPVAAAVHRRHPKVTVEIISTTRRATVNRSGLDIEVVVGEPTMLRARAERLAGYVLGLYGAASYFADHPQPVSIVDLADHDLVYFIGSMLHLDSLDVGRRLLPAMTDSVTSTNVFAHIEATVAGAGLGLLPTFLAAKRPSLRRVLEADVNLELDYWIVTRPDEIRRAGVAALYDELTTHLATMTDPAGHLR